jgi:biotin-dependent carboxylase-like uncharacterized protein
VIEVVRPGSLTTVQDLGRPGLAHIGVPPSGAADKRSLRLANRLVGNHEDAPALETTLRGPVLRFHAPVTVALAGAPADARVGRRRLAMHAVEHLGAGEELDVGVATGGARTYLAVRGGLAVDPVLGSASADLLTGLGPPRLAAGDRFEIGDRVAGWPVVDAAAVCGLPVTPLLRVLPGPREDWFAEGALGVLCSTTWEVTPSSNRVGVRLTGGRLERAGDDELPSEGVVTGAIEVPPSGEPIVLLDDHPVTGGYPVLAVVAYDDLPRAGQLRPGGGVRFTVVPISSRSPLRSPPARPPG